MTIPCGVPGCACPDFTPDGYDDADPCRCAHPDTDHHPEDDDG